eukprot:c19608_g1_i1.p1 GENE.c19608_g1_i1~~c19608_g1_i1.p1  ORF type:complete len:655 (-),score=145.19 c19608_g1_i1:2019-3755(-)
MCQVTETFDVTSLEVNLKLHARTLLGCVGGFVSDAIIRTLHSTLASPPSPGAALSALDALMQLKQVKNRHCTELESKFSQLADKRTGMYRDEKGRPPTLRTTIAVWRILSICQTVLKSKSQALVQASEGAAKVLQGVLDSGVQNGDELAGSELSAMRELVVGIEALARAANSRMGIAPDQVAFLASYFVGLSRGADQTSVPSLTHAFDVVVSITTLVDSRLGAPVVVQLTPPSLPLASTRELSVVSVTNILDQPLNLRASVPVLVSVKQPNDGTSLLKDMPTEFLNGEHTIDLSRIAKTLGLYDVEITAFPVNADPIRSVRSLKVTSQAELRSVVIRVGNLEHSVLQTEQPRPLRVEEDDKLDFLLEIVSKATKRPILPHQVFVLLEGKDSSTTLIARPHGKRHRVVWDKRNSHLRGRISATVLIGDMALDEAISRRLCDLILDFESQATVPSSSSSYLDCCSPLPEKFHVMRPSDPPPSPAIGTLFSVLAVCPHIVLVFGLFRLGLSPVRFLSPHATISAVLFVISVASMAGLLVWSWVWWPTLTALKMLVFALPIVFVVANRALSAVHDAHTQPAK